jgi:hypothetical protein
MDMLEPRSKPDILSNTNLEMLAKVPSYLANL